MSFTKGDFFHVISREDDEDWYEACNPLIPSARGLVPVTFFETIGKNERESHGSVASIDEHKQQELHDSGFSDQGGHHHTRSESTNTTKQGARARMSAIGKGSGAMVYGIVQYDFNAERPDELEAKAGEAIIVIAQSNPEWFVAKPIGRLGGPGLIPVSFIEIRDMTTGQAVPDAHDAVKRAGVPKVEEWKKMTAEYKNSSITLGKIESGGSGQITNDMDNMDINDGNRGYNQNGNGNEYVRTTNLCSMCVIKLLTCRVNFRKHIIRTTVELASSNSNNRVTIDMSRSNSSNRTISSPCLHQSQLQSHATASIMTNTGTSLRHRWRMADTGNCHDSITIFMISRSNC